MPLAVLAAAALPLLAAASPRSNAAVIGDKIKHVVVIVQENRSFDNVFHAFPGADTVDSGKGHDGRTIPLKATSLLYPHDLNHAHSDFLLQYDRGKMDGFDLEHPDEELGGHEPQSTLAYSYIPRNQVQPYWGLRSFVRQPRCDLVGLRRDPPHSLRRRLEARRDNAGDPRAARRRRESASVGDMGRAVRAKLGSCLGRRSGLQLQEPLRQHRAVVGLIDRERRRREYWNDTAIFVLWDDWGGWYDHVAPPQLDRMGLGIRVPLVVVSPYAKRGYVSHAQHEFGSILKFTEEAYGVPSLNDADARSDDLADCFDFTQEPRAFTKITAPQSASFFFDQPVADAPPDSD